MGRSWNEAASVGKVVLFQDQAGEIILFVRMQLVLCQDPLGQRANLLLDGKPPWFWQGKVVYAVVKTSKNLHELGV